MQNTDFETYACRIPYLVISITNFFIFTVLTIFIITKKDAVALTKYIIMSLSFFWLLFLIRFVAW